MFGSYRQALPKKTLAAISLIYLWYGNKCASRAAMSTGVYEVRRGLASSQVPAFRD
jgi:hypothetical protein